MSTGGGITARVELLARSWGIGTEGFRIVDGENGSIRIIGNDELGLLYGVGKAAAHEPNTTKAEWTPGTWRGTSVPVCPVRRHLLRHAFQQLL